MRRYTSVVHAGLLHDQIAMQSIWHKETAYCTCALAKYWRDLFVRWYK